MTPNAIMLPRIGEIRELVNKGIPKREIAHDMGVKYKTFRAFCQRHHISKPASVRHPKKPNVVWTPQMFAQMTMMFLRGATQQEMGAAFNVSCATIANRLKETGLIKTKVRPLKKMAILDLPKPKDKPLFYPLPWYDFRAWSKGAQPGQKFIYHIGNKTSERLTLLMLAMQRDESVVTSIDKEGRRWCEKVDVWRVAA